MKLLSNKRYQSLIWDNAFDMYTRAGLKEANRLRKDPFDVIFIDLCDIHEWNNEIGYQHVNEMVSLMFKDVNGMKGRWFSGDEIVILTEPFNTDLVYNKLKDRTYPIKFKSAILKNITFLWEIQIDRVDLK